MKAGTTGSCRITERRGMVLVHVAVVLVVLTVFVALAVDIGVIATASAQLKAATDAAALAGARQLASDRRISTTISDLTPEMTSATAFAISTANANSVLGKALSISSQNVVIGYKALDGANADSPDAPLSVSTSSTKFNSVQVTASVNVSGLFTAPFRSGGSTVSVTSTASVELVQVSGFTIGTANTSILPLVMDSAAYSRMVSGTGGDSYTFTPANYNPPNANGVTSGADGVTESVAYPVTTGLSGNWGTIKFGVSNNSTSTLGDQISNGVTPTQMTTEFPSGTVTLPHTFSANPGISAAVKSNLTGIIGKPVFVPIYDTSGGSGNNAWYNATSFASVRIVAVDLTGNPKYVVVQPALSTDSSAILDTSNPNPWSAGGAVFLRLSR